ncbi:MAG: CRISPR-associated protein Cas2 [Candidatus Kapabacteria bacterium]|jgi:hypothetical protein|nr:CRISPR-associated protein Cas2 [Candidatus Kapabacteria bacterium]
MAYHTVNNTYIISYDLSQGGDYDAIFNAIKSYKTWAHITQSTWAIATDKSITDVRDHLKSLMSAGSRIFVVKSASLAAWDNVICSNEWLKKNL